MIKKNSDTTKNFNVKFKKKERKIIKRKKKK